MAALGGAIAAGTTGDPGEKKCIDKVQENILGWEFIKETKVLKPCFIVLVDSRVEIGVNYNFSSSRLCFFLFDDVVSCLSDFFRANNSDKALTVTTFGR